MADYPHLCGDIIDRDCGAVVCDLPVGHPDEWHQQSGGVVWRYVAGQVEIG